jgi:hypothetical protein
MKLRAITFVLLASMLFWACTKNTVSNGSNVPYIALMALYPMDSMTEITDTAYIEFSLIDGQGNIGYTNPTPGDTSAIYLKDSRFDSAGFVPTQFPVIDESIENPKYGLQGTCNFFPVPQPALRTDSLHTAIGRDTFTYSLYITDRAGHHSDTIVMPPLIILK